MTQPHPHAIAAIPTHDEAARTEFVQSFKVHLATQVMPGNRTVYEKSVRPAFEREHGRAPENRRDVRSVMNSNPYYRMWGSLQRSSQEMLWDSVGETVARDAARLNKIARSNGNGAGKANGRARGKTNGKANGKIRGTKARGKKRGSLTLNASLKMPRYLDAVDIHCMPGNYDGRGARGDVSAGALYDRGVYYYAMSSLGPVNDAMGRRMIAYLERGYPGLAPKRILDMGCTVGNSTLPYAAAFPGAEVHAIDVAESVLRYAHVRLDSLGAPVHLSQQNAEHTNFPDGHFDLVVSHILLHELSNTAIRNIMRESHRLLAPGGVTAHADLPLFQGLAPYDAFILDWDALNNNEPFWTTLREMDPVALMTGAGFAEAAVTQTWVARDPGGDSVYSDHAGDTSARGSWYVLGASK